MARAIIGGMIASVVTSVFIVPILWHIVNARTPAQVRVEDL
jgi:multidrug efflux pump subunit AcrB